MDKRPDLRDVAEAELAGWIEERGHPRYRLGQILAWLDGRGAGRIDEMSDLPGPLRGELAGAFKLGLPRAARRLQSRDGAIKLGFELGDGEVVEAVLMPEGRRVTLCVSTQAGCRMGCRFCATGQAGFRRQLLASELLGQIIVARGLGPLTNVVLMGMGEPLDNLDQVLAALRVLCGPKRLAMSPRHVTLSTVGPIPAFARLAVEAPPVKLAVSLHSAVQETRDAIAPGVRSYRLDDLKRALQSYPLRRGDRLTLELVLLGGINDTAAEARALKRWLSGLRAKVNLIPFNPFGGSEFKPPAERSVLALQEELVRAGVPTFIRKSRGTDIMAACGQLRASLG